jgi:hypothetical protein
MHEEDVAGVQLFEVMIVWDAPLMGGQAPARKAALALASRPSPLPALTFRAYHTVTRSEIRTHEQIISGGGSCRIWRASSGR